MKYFLILLGFLALVSCADKSNGSGEVAVKSSGDATTDAIYNELMARILDSSLGYADTGSTSRAGEKNPYRQGSPGYQHKALSACLLWDVEKLTVRYQGWHSNGHRDWNYASYFAVDRCEKNKLQKNYDCKCQLIDHDDVIVLEVPNDYRAAYDRSKSN